jgi:cyclopropane fatty-acyl-phospholipid synthase-like methyltransferase
MKNGGYDEGYSAVPCFWGEDPGSLVKLFLEEHSVEGNLILDLGCGEGKNAHAFAAAGATAIAVDCSKDAIRNGKAVFGDSPIDWRISDATSFAASQSDKIYDVVVAYGLLHCISSEAEADVLINDVKRVTKTGGTVILVAFNDRSQDLSAHPGFEPLLLPHHWYAAKFGGWRTEVLTDTDLHETHPHNGIPHHHSLTRLIARKSS